MFFGHTIERRRQYDDHETDDTGLGDVARKRQHQAARNHGLRYRHECEFWSVNSRLDTLQAAMLLVKLKYLDECFRNQ